MKTRPARTERLTVTVTVRKRMAVQVFMYVMRCNTYQALPNQKMARKKGIAFTAAAQREEYSGSGMTSIVQSLAVAVKAIPA